jgi:hypothetical protein
MTAEDFHLQVTHSATTAEWMVLAHHAPCWAHTNKTPTMNGLEVLFHSIKQSPCSYKLLRIVKEAMST